MPNTNTLDSYPRATWLIISQYPHRSLSRYECATPQPLSQALQHNSPDRTALCKTPRSPFHDASHQNLRSINLFSSCFILKIVDTFSWIGGALSINFSAMGVRELTFSLLIGQQQATSQSNNGPSQSGRNSTTGACRRQHFFEVEQSEKIFWKKIKN